ncbi:MAG: polysaccharide pyruvyl transferase family protein [Aquamicrobium sp.]|jgi:colanic acid/amylovoran biosynthesis protein|nr:polysaccharide pyruvyl transferase family protein [Mesorhizobium sp. Pch-S]MBR2692326.1 polysaccharide pyruvyl transferase family protein [Aquamicrobium sp.]QAZ46305.1 hypothetical protein C1M53_28660 [Mesorhizobium sp. Pch-S]
MRFAITGVTISGNMGGAAMLAAATDTLNEFAPGSQLSLLSITPDKDRELPLAKEIEIVNTRPKALLLVYLPLSILLWPFAKFGFVRRLLSCIPYFQSLISADAVVDLCGIAFVDKRGSPLLAYNAACCLPAIVVGTPVAKLAQALGPFETQPNRMVAKFVLKLCKVVVARGEKSLKFLHDLGIQEAISLPDTSFAMEVNENHRKMAREMVPELAGNQLLVVSPSEVVKRLSAAQGIDLETELTTFLLARISQGWKVLIVPHSFGVGKNNDLDLCRSIIKKLPADSSALVNPPQDPRTLRALIGKADAFVGCRFHSVVAALSQGVPSLVIGWSHKYQEMMAMLQPGEWFIDASRVSASDLEVLFRRFDEARPQLVAAIAEQLPTISIRAKKNFALAVEVGKL